MNRTTAFLALAGALVLTAVIAGLPRNAVPPTAAPPAPPSTPIVAPQLPPPQTPPVAAAPGSLTLTGSLSHPYLVPGTSDLFATLQVSAVEVKGQRAPVNLALVIDRSGSMAGEKLEQAKRAAAHLVDLLDENDRLAIVHYGNDVRAFPAAMCTAETRLRMKRYIAGIQEQGGTNIGEGLTAGQAQLSLMRSDFRVNRLLLLSDGQPTVGVTSPVGLTRIVSSIRSAGISVTSMGVGADFNEDLMQRLADVGGGSYGFISNATATATLFEKDLKQAGTMVAQSVSLRFTLPEGVTLGEVFGRPTAVEGRTVTVTMPDFAAGQVEKLVIRLTAVTASAAQGSTLDVARFELAYRDLRDQRDAASALSLSAMLTHDVKIADARRNKDAYLDATRAQTSVNYKKAALAIDQGDFATANRAIEANNGLLEDAAGVGGALAVEEDKKDNAVFFGLTSSAAKAPAEQQRERVKGLKVKALKTSGRGDSVY